MNSGNNLKICMDCKHCLPHHVHGKGEFSKCAVPFEFNKVTGDARLLFCDTHRGTSSSRYCGVNGRFFIPITPEQPTAPQTLWQKLKSVFCPQHKR